MSPSLQLKFYMEKYFELSENMVGKISIGAAVSQD